MNTTTDRLQQHLQALPEPELPDALWTRLDGARQRRLDRRRGAGVVVAALVVLSLVPLLQLDRASPGSVTPVAAKPTSQLVRSVDATPAQPATADAPSIAGTPIDSGPARHLPADSRPIASVRADAPATGVQTVNHMQTDARLRALDRDLQAAYREGSSDAEIAQLWQARRALLDGDGDASAANPVRI